MSKCSYAMHGTTSRSWLIKGQEVPMSAAEGDLAVLQTALLHLALYSLIMPPGSKVHHYNLLWIEDLRAFPTYDLGPSWPSYAMVSEVNKMQ
jgi:hypothetical protein